MQLYYRQTRRIYLAKGGFVCIQWIQEAAGARLQTHKPFWTVLLNRTSPLPYIQKGFYTPHFSFNYFHIGKEKLKLAAALISKGFPSTKTCTVTTTRAQSLPNWNV